jgi:hypothetical protein
MAASAVHPRPDGADNDNDPLGPRGTPIRSTILSTGAPLRPSAWSRANLSPATTAAIALSASQSLRNSPGETSKMRET